MNTRIKNEGEVMKKSLFASIFMVLPFVFVCFGLSPAVRAVVPAPDGGYPGFNTAEGTNALFSLTSGVGNNAIGFQALLHNTTGIHNTADGFAAMSRTTTGQHNTATSDFTLQERDRSPEDSTVWAGGRRRGSGQSGLGGP